MKPAGCQFAQSTQFALNSYLLPIRQLLLPNFLQIPQDKPPYKVPELQKVSCIQSTAVKPTQSVTMIGMMNNHSVDNQVDFYAGRRALPLVREGQQLEIQLVPVQKKLSYTEEGRRLVDGAPEESGETPTEMWSRLMLKMSCNKAIEEGLARAGRKKRGSKLIQRILSHGGSLRHMLTKSSNANRRSKDTTGDVKKRG